MSIERFNAIDASVASNQDNLDLYISRIYDNRYTEDHIKHNFQFLGIGIVDYADIVATKDPVTKEIVFYSAFIKLREWNTAAHWYADFIRHKSLKIVLSKTEFWAVFPAKKPLLPRSKVNTHQLAAYTDELFEKFEKQSKQLEVQQQMIDLQSKNIEQLLGKLEEQTAEIKAIKQQQLASSDKGKEKEEDNRVFFTPSQRWKPLNAAAEALMKKPASSDIMSGTFEYDLSDIAKDLNMSENEIIKAFNDAQKKEKRTPSPENSQRVKTSNIICGNL